MNANISHSLVNAKFHFIDGHKKLIRMNLSYDMGKHKA